MTTPIQPDLDHTKEHKTKWIKSPVTYSGPCSQQWSDNLPHPYKGPDSVHLLPNGRVKPDTP